VRSAEDLAGLDGIVLPGGESTTMTMLMERVGLLEPLRVAIKGGLPTLATCAGMIVLAREVSDGMAGQLGLGLLDIAVRRNGYGRQVDSFEADLQIAGLEGKAFPAVFIRSPLVESTGAVEVIATYEGHAVAVRQGRVLALCFHPELTSDLRLHREFVRMAAGAAS
jgi:pyridoxal 5'-phosphate synthase pdxT subunit